MSNDQRMMLEWSKIMVEGFRVEGKELLLSAEVIVIVRVEG